MFSYFVLWIPVLQKGDLKIINQKLDDVVLNDLPNTPDLHIKASIDNNTYNITFEYWFQDNDRHTYTFEHVENKNTGFIVYRVCIDDDAADFVSDSFKKGLHKSFYHYIIRIFP